MNRLLMSACVAAFAMSGAVASALAAETAAVGAESAAAKAGSRAANTNKTKLAHLRTSGLKSQSIPTAVTKEAREVEAIEAVSTADAPRQSADASASDQPADAAAADTPNAASQTADANAGDRSDAPALDPNADAKPAAVKPHAHMNTGHPQIDALVATHARVNNVPEALIHRVIVRESKYQKDLVGSCGCIGLMQIKLGTARGLGYGGDARGLHDPDTNLTYGVKYLAGAYRAANGDHDRTIHYFARGYYEVAKRQRLAAARPFGRLERIHAPLDITPKRLALAHAAKRVAAAASRQAATSVDDAQARVPTQ